MHVLCAPLKELCNGMGVVTFLTVLMKGELLCLQIWRKHTARSAQTIVATCFPCNNLNVCVI